MTGDQIASLAYLGILLFAVLGWFLMQDRISLGKTLQQALVWFFLFLAAIAGYGLWADISHELTPQTRNTANGQIEIPADFAGHFNLVAELNSTPVSFLVDTGATEIVLTQEDAKRIGLSPADLDYFGQAQTANGTVRTARTRVENLELGNRVFNNILVSVNQAPMQQSLLGMSLLNQMESVEIKNGVMRLQP